MGFNNIFINDAKLTKNKFVIFDSDVYVIENLTYSISTKSWYLKISNNDGEERIIPASIGIII